MVLTRQSPDKNPPAGVTTCRRELSRRGRANLRAYRVWQQQRAAQANAVDVEVRSAEEMREDSNESPLPLLTQPSHPTSVSPVRQSPRLRLELPDDDDDDKKSKSDMDDVELFDHFDKRLQRNRTCGNKGCSCLRILVGKTTPVSLLQSILFGLSVSRSTCRIRLFWNGLAMHQCW
jgi:hypothetical protein